MLELFHGKNTFLSLMEAKEHLKATEGNLLKENQTYEVKILDASTCSSENIVTEIETPSFFVTSKVIFLKRPSQNSNKDDLLEYLLTAAEKSTLPQNVNLLIWEDQKLRSNSKLVKTYQKKAKLYESPDLNKRTFLKWAQDQLAAQNLKITSNATHLLSERTNYDPERFFQEAAKLKLLNKDIDESDIEATCPDTLEHTIWSLIDAVNSGQSRQATRELRKVVSQGNDPLYILLMMARNMRIILLTKLLLEKGLNPGEIARKIKVPPFTINMIKAQALQIPLTKVKKIYDKISNIDYSGKTGQLDVELALSILLSVI